MADSASVETPLSRPEIRPEGSGVRETVLTTGHSIMLRASDGGESLEIVSPAGAVEVSIDFSSGSPVVRITGASLEIASAGRARISCDGFEVASRGAVRVSAEGDVDVESGSQARIKCAGDARVDGARVLLNCDQM